LTCEAKKLEFGRIISFPKEEKLITKEQRGDNYTSRGIRKATRGDPIRKKEDIQRIYEYLMAGGWNPRKGPDFRDTALFMLGFTSGLRCGDILNLQARDVCPFGKCNEYVRICEQKTGKSQRFKIPEQTREVLDRYFAWRGKMNPTDYIFQGTKGNAMSLSRVNQIIYQMQRDLKLPYNLSSHSMRKTFAYWTIMSHPNDSQILLSLQKMFNHSSVQVTLHYAGFLDESYDQIRDDVGDVLLGFTEEV